MFKAPSPTFELFIFLILFCYACQNKTPETATTDPPVQKEQSEEKGTLTVGSVLAGCEAFPQKLANAEPYTCEFTHPFTNEKMKRTIKGIIDGKCVYVEEMPNGGQMICKYNEERRKAVADYFDQMFNSQTSIRTQAKLSLEPGDENIETKTSIDGQAIESPFQKSLDDGTCVVIGYGD